MEKMNSQIEVYEDFDDYNWDGFTDFQEGLKQILDNYLDELKNRDPTTQVESIPLADKEQLINQAKVFYYCSKSGNILNLDDYEAWKSSKIQNTEKPTVEEPTVEEVERLQAEEQTVGEAPYSSNYQQVVELILSGKPIPGIKQIPDTVLSSQSSKPEAKQRLKPWEKNTSTDKVTDIESTK